MSQPYREKDKRQRVKSENRVATMAIMGGGGLILALLDARGPKMIKKSIVCQKLAMEELPFLKEKQALKFKEKFS